MHTLCSWSGGKDSCFALMRAKKQGYKPVVLLNVLNEQGKISRSHGLPTHILEAQADAMQIPVHLIASSWNDYEMNFISALKELKENYALTHAVFGDIDLQPHRDWEEKVCMESGLQAVLPLWKEDRYQLVMSMLNSGIKTMIVSCNETMGARFPGRFLDETVVAELQSLGVDVCGENGEFHTVVVDCPLFSKPIPLPSSTVVKHGDYWFSVFDEPGSSFTG